RYQGCDSLGTLECFHNANFELTSGLRPVDNMVRPSVGVMVPVADTKRPVAVFIIISAITNTLYLKHISLDPGCLSEKVVSSQSTNEGFQMKTILRRHTTATFGGFVSKLAIN
ncbi:MAG: hypothetical protein IT541_13085, partial [Hyphomicrobiales bacterium]|nr:hypothetical protein [Hyphomicrobiales bacterium]